MKLRNKKTGEIKDVNGSRILVHFDDGEVERIESLAELNAEWEDYRDEEFYLIDGIGGISNMRKDWDLAYRAKIIGNYFESVEEAKKVVEKLKAWKRLKDSGFKFNNWIYDYREAENENERGLSIGASYNQLSKINVGDINLLFGGEE